MALPVSAADCTAQVSLAMRAYESDCIRPHIWATTEALLARLFAPIASDDDRQAERTDRPMPTFEDALAQHHGLSLPDPEPPCTREAMFDVEVADWTPRNRTIELWFTRADLEPVSERLRREPLARRTLNVLFAPADAGAHPAYSNALHVEAAVHILRRYGCACSFVRTRQCEIARLPRCAATRAERDQQGRARGYRLFCSIGEP